MSKWINKWIINKQISKCKQMNGHKSVNIEY